MNRYSHVGVIHKIADVAPFLTNTRVVGVVISKSAIRKFEPSDDERFRNSAPVCSMSMVIRDSIVDTVNVLVRGSQRFIEEIFCFCDIGAVVLVDNAEIQSKNSNEAMARYLPFTTSDLVLRVREGGSLVTEYSGDTFPFSNYARLPTVPDNAISSIKDVLTVGLGSDSDETELYHFMGVVKQVGLVRKLARKGDGTGTCVLELNLIDESLEGAPTMFLVVEFWGSTRAYRATSWPIGTVLLLTSVAVRWDDFRQCRKGVVGDRSIVIVNPISRRANRLLSYLPRSRMLDFTIWDAQPLAGPGELKGTFVQLEDFLKVLLNWATDKNRNRTSFVAWISGIPTGITMSTSFIRRLCINCKRTLRWGQDSCTYPNCSFVRMNSETLQQTLVALGRKGDNGSGSDPRVLLNFNFQAHLVDEKTSVRLYLAGFAARETLKISEEEFLQLGDEGRKRILEKFAFTEFNVLVRVKVPLLKTLHEKKATISRFLSCSVIQMEPLTESEMRKRNGMLIKRGLI